MTLLIVVDDPDEWPLDFPGVELVEAQSYLREPDRWPARGVTVFNLCRSYRYQGTGWYVSLLGTARGHRPIPSVATLRDISSPSLVRTISEDLDELIQSSLGPLHGDEFVLSVYFGRNLAERHARLAKRLYNLFQVPFVRARFERKRDRWALRSVSPIAAEKIPANHRDFVLDAARSYFAAHRFSVPRRTPPRYHLAILHDPDEPTPPSDERALQRFVKAAAALDIAATLIRKDDYARLAEFDALFIRATTSVVDHTYDFARRGEALGLVVIDDPASIVRATNKVFLAELLARHGVPHPRTMLVHAGNADAVADELGLPCVLKRPDSAFSLGVVRVSTRDELSERLANFFQTSDLVVAQEFVTTDYDWRIGVLDRQPLYACRYHMARGHWQIVRRDDDGKTSYGRVQAVPLDDVPPAALRAAVRAADLIGDGLYGVDVKTAGDTAYVIEVNDNPNIEAGYEDGLLGDELYRRILAVFLERIVARKAERPSGAAPRRGPTEAET